MATSKLSDVDPTFREVVSMLYGEAVDPRELWDIAKSMPTGADLHVPGMGGTAEQKNNRKRKALAGGLVLGTAAEGTATAEATKNAYNAFKKPVVPNIPKAADHIGKPPLPGMKHIKNPALVRAAGDVEHAGGKGKAAAAGMLALQATNMGVGLASARELTKKPVSKTLMGYSKPFVKLSRAEQLNIINTSKKSAKRAQKTLVAGGITAAGVGGYVGAKKYSLKRADEGKPALPELPKRKSDESTVTKADTYTWEGTISKVDSDKQLVFGWCSLSKINGEPVVDLQGDYIPIEETEAAAYRYVIESRKGGDMHKRVSKLDSDEPLHTADLVESMVITGEKLEKMGLPPDALPHGWWIGMKVNDNEQWQNVKNGKRLGFSVHGKGRREERDL